jgi:DNA-binding transcriptional ArsR family regulator
VCSPIEIAREIGAEVSDVSYHIRQLLEHGYIELVDTRQRRGATEHFYRAKGAVILDDEEWRQLPGLIQQSISADLINQLLSDVAAALEAGSFDARTRHLSRVAMHVDEQGWEDLMRTLEGTLERLLEIQRESAERLELSGEPGIPALAGMAGFEAGSSATADGNGAMASRPRSVSPD